MKITFLQPDKKSVESDKDKEKPPPIVRTKKGIASEEALAALCYVIVETKMAEATEEMIDLLMTKSHLNA